jgi:hypothetical protein
MQNLPGNSGSIARELIHYGERNGVVEVIPNLAETVHIDLTKGNLLKSAQKPYAYSGSFEGKING